MTIITEDQIKAASGGAVSITESTCAWVDENGIVRSITLPQVVYLAD